jgi:hypothetical protein
VPEAVQIQSATPTLTAFAAVLPAPISVGAVKADEDEHTSAELASVPAKFEQTLAALAAIEASSGEGARRTASSEETEPASEMKEVHTVSEVKAMESGIAQVVEAPVQPAAAEAAPAAPAEEIAKAPATASKQRTRAERLAALEAARAAAVEAVRARTAAPATESATPANTETVRPSRSAPRMRTNAKARPVAKSNDTVATASADNVAVAALAETGAGEQTARSIAAQPEIVADAPSSSTSTGASAEIAPTAQSKTSTRAAKKASARSSKSNKAAKSKAQAEAIQAHQSIDASLHATARTILPPPPAGTRDAIETSDVADVTTATVARSTATQSTATAARADAHSIAAAHDDSTTTARGSVRPSLPPQVENARSAILAAFARKANEDDTSSRPTARPSFRIARVALRPKPQQIVETVAPSAIKSEPAPALATRQAEPEPPITLRPAKASDARASVRAAFKNRGDASTPFATEGGNAASTNARRGDESAVIPTAANATAETVRPSARAAKGGESSSGVQRTSDRAADATQVFEVARHGARIADAAIISDVAASAEHAANPIDTAKSTSIAARADETPASDDARDTARTAGATQTSDVAPVTARTEAPDPTRIAQARDAMLATLAKARSLIPSKSRNAARASEPTTEKRARSQATRTHEDAPAARSSSI